MTPAQERRLSEFRSRAAVRAFEYRHCSHARGVWFRLRRLLALASEAYVVPRQEGEQLIAEGCRPDPVGWELAPSRLIIVVPPSRAAQIPSARPLPVRLSAELLAAECLVLVPCPV